MALGNNMNRGKRQKKDKLIPDSKEDIENQNAASSEESKEEIEYDENGIAKLLPGETRGQAAARRIKEKKALEESGSLVEETTPVSKQEEAVKDEIEYDENGIAKILPGETRGQAAARRIKEKKALEESTPFAEKIEKTKDEIEYDENGIAKLLPGETRGQAAARRIKEKKELKDSGSKAEEKPAQKKKSTTVNSDDDVEYDEDGVALLLPGETRGKAAARRIKEKRELKRKQEEEAAGIMASNDSSVETIGSSGGAFEQVLDQVEEEQVEEEEEHDERIQLVVFKLGKEEYAISIDQIKEVVVNPVMMKAPHVKDYVIGVVNIRGTVVTVIDLAIKFGIANEDIAGLDKNYSLVVDSEEYKVSILVKDVPDSLTIYESEIEPASNIAGESGEGYIKGILKIEDRMIVVFDIVKLLSNQEESAVINLY